MLTLCDCSHFGGAFAFSIAPGPVASLLDSNKLGINASFPCDIEEPYCAFYAAASLLPPAQSVLRPGGKRLTWERQARQLQSTREQQEECEGCPGRTPWCGDACWEEDLSLFPISFLIRRRWDSFLFARFLRSLDCNAHLVGVVPSLERLCGVIVLDNQLFRKFVQHAKCGVSAVFFYGGDVECGGIFLCKRQLVSCVVQQQL